MSKLKILLPSLKEKKRYLVYEILADKDLDKNISNELINKLDSVLGVFDGAKAGLQSISYDKNAQKGMLRVNNKQVDKLKTSLMLIKHLNNQEIIIKTIGVSGIIKKAKQKYLAQ